MERGFTVWVTGPDEAANTRVANAVAERLTRRHVPMELLHRQVAGFDALGGPTADRAAAFVAAGLARHGVGVVVAVPSPSRAERDRIRADLGRLIEVYVPRTVGAVGYEPPERAEVQIDFPDSDLAFAADRVLRTLEVLGLLAAGDAAYSEEEERAVIERLKAFGYL